MKIILVGDVMLGRLVNEVLRQESPEYPWGDTVALFRQADWRACNLECVLSERGRPWVETPKAYHFRSDPRNLAVLRAAGIDAVSLANNHALDFGTHAMLDMLDGLRASGVLAAGAGPDLLAASAPVITEVRGCRIGWISFTDNQPEWEALPHQPGVFHVPVDVSDPRTVRLMELVRHVRQRVHVLIVSSHWGGNWGHHPPASHVEFGRALVAAGADVVFGHSPHVFRGIELHRGRLILYSAGDFIDDYAVDARERNDRSFIFSLELVDFAPRRMRLYPTIIRDCQARMARGGEAGEIMQEMTRLCGELGTPVGWVPGEDSLEIHMPERGPLPGPRG